MASFRRNIALDSTKGLAILMVIITHFEWTTAERQALLFPFWISMAVPLFMLVTGYVTAASYDRKGVTSLRAMYQPRLLWRKFGVYTIPFACMYAIQILAEALNGTPLSLPDIVKRAVLGGVGGFGTYYYPFLIQLLFLLPLIYVTVTRVKKGLLICFLINVLYEVLQSAFSLSGAVYRILVLRYLFAVAVGCYLFTLREKPRHLGKAAIVAALGAGFIFLVSYTAYEPVVFTRWTNTSLLTVLYAAPAVYAALTRTPPLGCNALAFLGKRSYHIFLVQILYYRYVAPLLNFPAPYRYVSMALGVVICVAAGCGFYALYTAIASWGRNTFYSK